MVIFIFLTVCDRVLRVLLTTEFLPAAFLVELRPDHSTHFVLSLGSQFSTFPLTMFQLKNPSSNYTPNKLQQTYVLGPLGPFVAWFRISP